MLKIDKETKANKCGRCKRVFGPEEKVQWQETRVGDETVFQIWCALCVEDKSIGDNVSWSQGAWFVCNSCGGAEMAEVAEVSGWSVGSKLAGPMCPFCRDILRGRVDDPLPLSCLPKTQEITDPTGNPRRIPLWLHGTVLMTLFVSIGLNWLFLALSSALVYLAMGIWKRLERTKTPNLPPRKREVLK
jgi:hypothetical protein